jgi:hypothetical protein
MKEIAVTGGITAHRGYLITKALFPAKPAIRKIIRVPHMSGLAWRIAYTSSTHALRGWDPRLR